jgi:hypothetical protein
MCDRKYYKDDLIMNAFFKSMIYLIETFFRSACTTNVLRDEDVSLVVGIDQRVPGSRMELLKENVDSIETVQQNLSSAINATKSDDLKAFLLAQTLLVKFSCVYFDADAITALNNATP